MGAFSNLFKMSVAKWLYGGNPVLRYLNFAILKITFDTHNANVTTQYTGQASCTSLGDPRYGTSPSLTHQVTISGLIRISSSFYRRHTIEHSFPDV